MNTPSHFPNFTLSTQRVKRFVSRDRLTWFNGSEVTVAEGVARVSLGTSAHGDVVVDSAKGRDAA